LILWTVEGTTVQHRQQLQVLLKV